MPVSRDVLKVEGGGVPITVAAPEGNARLPILAVVPSIFGVGADLVEQMEELARVAVVIAMDPFWRVEPGPIPYAEMPRAFERVSRLDKEASHRDFEALLRWTRRHPRCGGRVVGLGICFGGPLCLMAAADGLLDGVVTWHGSLMHRYLGRASEMKCPMEHHFGDADAVVPLDTVEAIRATFTGREDVKIAIHPGAGHGFSHRAGPHFQADAEREAMNSARKLLALG